MSPYGGTSAGSRVYPTVRTHGRTDVTHPYRKAVNRPPITAIHPLIQSRITRQIHGRAAARQSGDPTCRHPAQDRPNWRSLWRRSFVRSHVVDLDIAGPAAIHAHARHVVENRRSSRNGSGVGGAGVGRGRACSALVRTLRDAFGSRRLQMCREREVIASEHVLQMLQRFDPLGLGFCPDGVSVGMSTG